MLSSETSSKKTCDSSYKNSWKFLRFFIHENWNNQENFKVKKGPYFKCYIDVGDGCWKDCFGDRCKMLFNLAVWLRTSSSSYALKSSKCHQHFYFVTLIRKVSPTLGRRYHGVTNITVSEQNDFTTVTILVNNRWWHELSAV